jgi:hypothetical protein
MSVTPGPPAPQRSPEKLRWVGGTLLLLFVGVPVCLLLTLPLGVATNPCGAGEVRLTCSTVFQLIVVWLPLIGLGLGLLTCVVGGLRRTASGASPTRALCWGWGVFVLAEVVVFGLSRL